MDCPFFLRTIHTYSNINYIIKLFFTKNKRIIHIHVISVSSLISNRVLKNLFGEGLLGLN